MAALTVEQNVTLPLLLAGRTADRGISITSWTRSDSPTSGTAVRPRCPVVNSSASPSRARSSPSRTRCSRDEPTGALDSRTGRQVLDLLRRTTTELGQTIVMVTHDPVAAAHADRVVFLADGRLVGRMDLPHPRRGRRPHDPPRGVVNVAGPRLRTLARANIRARRGSFAAVFVAVFCAALLTCALGVLFESGSGAASPHTVTRAPTSWSGRRKPSTCARTSTNRTSNGRCCGVRRRRTRRNAGVRGAVADLGVPLTTDAGAPLDAHGWASSVLAPYTLTSGRAPVSPDEVVVTGRVPSVIGSRCGTVGSAKSTRWSASRRHPRRTGRPATGGVRVRCPDP